MSFLSFLFLKTKQTDYITVFKQKTNFYDTCK
jgi:hypothetical protein